MSPSVFITLPKKLVQQNQMTKVRLKVILQQMRGRTKAEISEEHFGREQGMQYSPSNDNREMC